MLSPTEPFPQFCIEDLIAAHSEVSRLGASLVAQQVQGQSLKHTELEAT